MDEDLLLDAKHAFVQGNLEESIQAFDKILEQDPKHLVALFTRGTVKFKLEDFEGAIEDFTSYIGLNSSNEKVYCSLGNAYLHLNQDEKAFEHFNKAIRINPQYPSAYFSRSEVLRRMGEESQAEEDKETAEKLQQQLSKAYFESQGYMYDNH
ncbi:MAG: tetratricopeptide repeat protein [Proteobacteria bacterium]|nr:tetratricopeptide repeat protein [Pseudomonadota bacterium]